MYSTDPENDAARFYAAQDAYSTEITATRAMFEDMFLAACATGNGDVLTHGDAVSVRHVEPLGTHYTAQLQPLTKTMRELCESSTAGDVAMQALLTCAKDGNAHAVAAIKALAREYGEQKGDA
jgi:hypothetical protein